MIDEPKKEPVALPFSIYNDLPSHGWAADLCGQLIFTNDAWVAYSGCQKVDVVKNSLASVIHPEDVELAARVGEFARVTGFRCAFRFGYGQRWVGIVGS